MMPPATRLLSPDDLSRSTLLAVELLDPITQALVSQGVSVRAAGLEGRPIVNRSGRYVWLAEGEAWPTSIVVDPQRSSYVSQIASAPARPADLTTATALERHLRISLRPSLAYRFEDGVTVIRGRLREDVGSVTAPVEGARVQLAWRNIGGAWSPAPPAPENVDEAAEDVPSPPEQQTDRNGEFVVFLRLRREVGVEPDVDERRLLAVRLQVTRGRAAPLTRVTDDDFPFLPASPDPNTTTGGRVSEGRVLGREVTLAWSALTPI
jgi:hypothetical protein